VIGPTCPHQGASTAGAELCGTMVASEPGRYERGCHLGLVRCPCHRWDFHVVEGVEVQVSAPAPAR